MQVIYQCTATLRFWSYPQCVEHHDLFVEVPTRLEAQLGILLAYMDGSIIYSGLSSP
jgi:hypothetical protein